MNTPDKRKKEIEDLKKFVREDRIVGFVSHEYFRYLRTNYPSHFIKFVNQYKKKDIKQDKYKGLGEWLMESVNKVNGFNKEVNSYLVNPPQTVNDKKRFGELITKAEDVLEKQSKYN
jgi:hypothetical protein